MPGPRVAMNLTDDIHRDIQIRARIGTQPQAKRGDQTDAGTVLRQLDRSGFGGERGADQTARVQCRPISGSTFGSTR
jgi:hypothetical protein